MGNISTEQKDKTEVIKPIKNSKLLRVYLSHKLTQKKAISDPERLNTSIRSANIDLNPHQVDAAIFAFKSPLSRGAILADEVGLGKTIEAGLIINQLVVEGRDRILILVPASLRTQWKDELQDKFNLKDIHIIDGPQFRKLKEEKRMVNPLQESGIFISSHNFAYRYFIEVEDVNWDLVVIDEAHRLRNVWRKSNKTAKEIKKAIKNRPKILLTATPLQNNLMELFGLVSFLEENYLGTEYSFRTLFVNPIGRQNQTHRLSQLKKRLVGEFNTGAGICEGGVLTRALRNQLRGFVPFTNRHCITEDFAPNDNEIELYNSVSEYLRRPFLASTRATQRNMMELVYRKILASSTFAIAGTLEKVSNFLARKLQKEFGCNFEEINKIESSMRALLENEWKETLNPLILKKEDIESVQIEMPGLDDIEIVEEKLREEQEEADDLGEDEDIKRKKTPLEKESNHRFTKEEVVSEFKDVLRYYYLATTIDVNQKSQALVRVLKKVFDYATKMKWPKKVVIFTESRRTQDHLEKLLRAGFNIVLFNGTNASKQAKEIYEEWASKFPDEAEEGNKSINLRKSLVWKFKSLDSCVLITTEAGAEGLNLQFANIVVNYDLPWNPQRIEQRIGRCHRYGQELDVLVINFLNKKNYADQRVYELLSQKIKLFGNLFDFSDKVLGTEQKTDDGYEVREVALAGLGGGISFERRILDIYRNCRTKEDIEKSFNQLQLDLSVVITETIEQAKKKVIEHFDEEVREKLRLRKEKLKESLSSYDRQLKKYIENALVKICRVVDKNIYDLNGKKYGFDLTQKQRDEGIKPFHINIPFLKEYTTKDKSIRGNFAISLFHEHEKGRKVFEEEIGKEGILILDILNCQRKTINNQSEQFEELVISAAFNKDGQWKHMPIKLAEKLFDLDIQEEAECQVLDIPQDLISHAEKNVEQVKKETIDKNEEYVSEEREHLEQFVEESLLKFKQEMDEREKEIKEIKNRQKKSSRTTGFHEKQKLQDEIDKLQKELFKAQKKYFKAQEDQFKEKDLKITELRSKLQMNFEKERIAIVKFRIIA